MPNVKELEHGNHVIIYLNAEEAKKILEMLDTTNVAWPPCMDATKPSDVKPSIDFGCIMVKDGEVDAAPPHHFILQQPNQYKDYRIWELKDLYVGKEVGDHVKLIKPVQNGFCNLKPGLRGTVKHVDGDYMNVFFQFDYEGQGVSIWLTKDYLE